MSKWENLVAMATKATYVYISFTVEKPSILKKKPIGPLCSVLCGLSLLFFPYTLTYLAIWISDKWWDLQTSAFGEIGAELRNLHTYLLCGDRDCCIDNKHLFLRCHNRLAYTEKICFILSSFPFVKTKSIPKLYCSCIFTLETSSFEHQHKGSYQKYFFHLLIRYLCNTL